MESSSPSDLTAGESDLMKLSRRITELPQPCDTEARSLTKLCHLLPYPRNQDFFGREEELRLITNQLSLRPVLLWGMAGVGKSQIALEYCYRQIQQGNRVVLWINCENTISIGESFTNIAKRLDLPGVSEDYHSYNIHERNKYLVHAWLHKLNEPFLIVFDNMETNRIRDAIPLQTQGSYLITSRDRGRRAAHSLPKPIEIPTFSKSDGAALLLKYVGRRDYTSVEEESAHILSAMVSGLPLAIEHVASQIRYRRSSIEHFVGFYTKHSRRIHASKIRICSPYHSQNLNELWIRSFDALLPVEATILGVLSFLTPENTPLGVFEQCSCFPEHLDLEDEWERDEALSGLVSKSLIRVRDNMISVHRLIQSTFQDYMRHDQRQESLILATNFLEDAVSEQPDELSLSEEWTLCKTHLPNILKLAFNTPTV